MKIEHRFCRHHRVHRFFLGNTDFTDTADYTDFFWNTDFTNTADITEIFLKWKYYTKN